MNPPRALLPALAFIMAMRSFGQVYISGVVTHAPDSATARITFYNNTIEWNQVEAGAEALDAHWHFALQIPWPKPGPASLTIAEQHTKLFLFPGDSIRLTVDYDKFDSTLHYNGPVAAENNYMAADMLGNFEYQASAYMAFEDGNKYKLYVDSVEQLSNALWNAADTSAMRPAFRAYMRPELKYRFINPRYMFQVGYDQVNKKFYKKEVPAGYFDFLKAIDLNDQAAADNGTYSLALRRYLSVMEDSLMKWNDSLPREPQVAQRIRLFYNYRKSMFRGKVLDHQLTNFMKEQLENNSASPALTDSLVEDYRHTCRNPAYVGIIDEIQARSNRVAAGQPAPEATLVDSTGKEVLLSSYKGEVVFIDFWATWCVPCLASLPKSHALAEEYKGRTDVAFLFVNVNDTPERWRNFLRKEKPSGENLYADEERSNRMRKEFNFDGIPHYVLLDKQGRFINSNVPGAEGAKPLIEEALK
jgi:thiol-disulfide isomerase/thioredoxin